MHHPSTAEENTPLSFEIKGQGERVVLLHGFTQTSRSWRHIVDQLADDYEVMSVDLPGHGRSSERLVENIAAAAHLVGATCGRATYVGYSMGGRIALRLAIDAPELVERLVLVSATAGIADAAERAQRRIDDELLADTLDPNVRGAEHDSIDAFLAKWIAQPMFSRLSVEQADLPTRSRSLEGLASALRSLGTGTEAPLDARLKEWSMPVLLLAGEHDAKFTLIARALHESVGGQAALAIVAGADHAVPFSQPRLFSDQVRSFLASHPTRAIAPPS